MLKVSREVALVSGALMSASRNYVAPGWEEIYDMLLDMAITIRKSGFHADLIVGVSRGGWPPARILSDLLENARIANIRIECHPLVIKPPVFGPVS